jgi:hypothetical protein
VNNGMGAVCAHPNIRKTKIYDLVAATPLLFLYRLGIALPEIGAQSSRVEFEGSGCSISEADCRIMILPIIVLSSADCPSAGPQGQGQASQGNEFLLGVRGSSGRDSSAAQARSGIPNQIARYLGGQHRGDQYALRWCLRASDFGVAVFAGHLALGGIGVRCRTGKLVKLSRIFGSLVEFMQTGVAD